MVKVHASLLLLLTLLIASITLTTSTNPLTSSFKNQNAKTVKKQGEKDPTRIPYPDASAAGFQDMEIDEGDHRMVNGLNGAKILHLPFPFGFGFPFGIFGLPLGFGGFPLRGYGGNPGGYGGGGGVPGGHKPGGGGYGGKAEVKGKEVNPRH